MKNRNQIIVFIATSFVHIRHNENTNIGTWDEMYYFYSTCFHIFFSLLHIWGASCKLQKQFFLSFQHFFKQSIINQSMWKF